MRGRVMALYMAIFMGGTPIGAPVVGWVGETLGPRWTILIGGLVSLVTGLVALVYVVRTRGVRVRYRLGRTPHLQVTSAGAERAAAREVLALDAATDRRSAA
ncbi:hypothetical protein GCM10025868_16210 [Angustibacter aerolatus]|uniref:Major facilitator superfamily (MFS) profile domain-containing protein n=1 Tax=Angustibacter aerolatus TaxID=1162965 RepID=A0ABQ6JFN5_9ACTN|nr:hypothetical protein GCM10025868_16210 [Angustibacter aerolatus]